MTNKNFNACHVVSILEDTVFAYWFVFTHHEGVVFVLSADEGSLQDDIQNVKDCHAVSILEDTVFAYWFVFTYHEGVVFVLSADEESLQDDITLSN